jgi:hypothetical protein
LGKGGLKSVRAETRKDLIPGFSAEKARAPDGEGTPPKLTTWRRSQSHRVNLDNFRDRAHTRRVAIGIDGLKEPGRGESRGSRQAWQAKSNISPTIDMVRADANGLRSRSAGRR